MTLSHRSLATLLTLCLAALAPIGCAPQSGSETAPSQPPLAGADIGGPFELIDKHGNTVRWSDFDGSYRLVYFGYTFCPDVCPTETQRMMQGYKIFARAHPDRAARVKAIFISLDPERDRPEVVGEYAAAFSDDLIGLTGSKEAVAQAAKAFKVYYSRGETTPGGGYLVDHSNIVYLFGPKGEPIATLPTDLGAQAVAAELERWVK